MTEEAVTYQKDGAVALVTLNRPETRNALSQRLIDDLVAACAEADKDLSVRCMILTGSGAAFCSGGNLKDMQARKGVFAHSLIDTPAAYRRGVQRIPIAFSELDVPVIAAVNGPASGAGLDLAAMCDLRIASETAVFSESFIRVGLIPADGGAWFLPKVVGLAKAMELSYTAEPIDAAEALRIGLVSQVIKAENLLDAARDLAAKIVRHPPHAIRMTKRLMRGSQMAELPVALEMAATMQAVLQRTDDHAEAVSALLEKREPAFRGG